MDQNLFPNVFSVVRETSQDNPFFVYRPHALSRAVSYFLQHFRASVMFAVKTNPEPFILRALHTHGIKRFDVASIQEIRQIHSLLPGAKMYFMHPVKSRKAIREAYFTYGVRHFSLDSLEELYKIREETDRAKDLSLFVRLAIPNNYSELNLADKFGINPQEAKQLLKETAKVADKLGVCFHVGSQCMHPDAYRIAMRLAAGAVKQARVKLDYFNVGGGFPSIYPGMIPIPLTEYFAAIHEEFARIPGSEKMELMAEPGRALVAESTSLVVRVELRKGDKLYINDGTYGSLFDAGTPHFIFPVRLVREGGSDPSHVASFSFYGPTCDTLDFMKGPFYLPEDTREGDYIEIGQLGAYGRALSTGFNGFHPSDEVMVVQDDTLMTMYDENHHSVEPFEVIAA